MNTTPKDNTPDELDIFIWPDIFRPIGPGDDMVVSAEKLRDYIAREIDAVIQSDEDLNAPAETYGTDDQSLADNPRPNPDLQYVVRRATRDVFRFEQRQRAANRGWRIG